MKTVFLGAALFLTGAGLFAETRPIPAVSVDYFFAADLLRALYGLQEFLDKNDASLSTGAALEEVKTLMANYAGNSNKHVRVIARSVLAGVKTSDASRTRVQEMLASYVGFIYGALREPGAKNLNSISLQLSGDESAALLDQIDLFFGNNIRRFPQKWAALKKGFQTADPAAYEARIFPDDKNPSPLVQLP